MTHQYPTVSSVDKRKWPVAHATLGLLSALLPARALAQDTPAPGIAAAPGPSATANSTSPANSAQSETPASATHNETSNKEVCGHIGIAIPLVMMDHPTKSVGDEVNIAAPIGIGIKFDKLVFDFETIVATHIKQHDKPTGQTVDPGVVYDFGPFAAGIRVKWDIGAPPNIGVIPLIHRGIVDLGGATWFIEAVFPTTYVTKNVNFDVVLHTGLGF